MFSSYLLRNCRMKPDRVLFMLSALKYNLSTRSMDVEVWHSSTLLDAVRRGLARQPTAGTIHVYVYVYTYIRIYVYV
jgi:hypothetical protein